MKTIIAGGRDYTFTPRDIWQLDRLHLSRPITEVVSGCASGADTEGEGWAKSHGILVKPFRAVWDDITRPGAHIRTRSDGTKYDVYAGFLRNQKMADYADACVLFPGGSGTADMAARAYEKGLLIWDWRDFA